MYSGCIELTFYQRWDVSACHHRRHKDIRIHKIIMPSVLPKFQLCHLGQEDEMHLRAFISLFRQVLFHNLLRIAKSPKAQAGPGFLTPHGVNSSKIKFITDSSTSTQFLCLRQYQHLCFQQTGGKVTYLSQTCQLHFEVLPQYGRRTLAVHLPWIPSDIFEEAIVLYSTIIIFSRYFSLWFE